MDTGTLITIMQDAIVTTIKVAMPPLLVGLLIGFIISIFQATTQINEQTLSFVPKILCIFLALILFGGWMTTQLQDFFFRVYEYAHLTLILPWGW